MGIELAIWFETLHVYVRYRHHCDMDVHSFGEGHFTREHQVCLVGLLLFLYLRRRATPVIARKRNEKDTKKRAFVHPSHSLLLSPPQLQTTHCLARLESPPTVFETLLVTVFLGAAFVYGHQTKKYFSFPPMLSSKRGHSWHPQPASCGPGRRPQGPRGPRQSTPS